METNNLNATDDDIHRVNDVFPQVGAFVLLACLVSGWGHFSYLVYYGNAKDKLMVFAWVTIIFLPLSLLVFLRLKAIIRGVVVNNTQRTLSFPGGGISANGLGDIFKPSFLLQYFTVKTISLDEISSIQKETIQTTIKKDGRAHQVHTHYISCVGRFGAAKIKFSSEGKRDELYGSIRQTNNMGEPFVRA